MAGSIGSPGQTAVSKYLNANKIPQVIMMVGTTKLIDPVALPWTTTFYQSSLGGNQHLRTVSPGFKTSSEKLRYFTRMTTMDETISAD